MGLKSAERKIFIYIKKYSKISKLFKNKRYLYMNTKINNKRISELILWINCYH